jgi:catechol 2,3-dioxygenase-like lactoylglutathione lyase family enzyme
LVLRIHHVQLAMPEGGEETALAFYEGILGLREIPKPSHLERLGGLWFGCAASPVQLHIGVEPAFRPARKAHPALVVEDLDLVREALESAGYPIVVETQLEGYRRFYTTDPFGNRVEILAEDSEPSA